MSGASGKPPETAPQRVRNFFANLGPGLITGAADDDPSGISTYSVTGASFGYAPLWTQLFTFPLMTAVQMMCARLGMVTGRGLAGVVRRRYPSPVLWGACAILVIANTVNIAADLAGMAESMQMITHVSTLVWTPLFTIGITSLLLWTSYRRIVIIFKWLTLALFAYIIEAVVAHANWGAVLRSTFIPHIEWSGNYMSALVGIFGTTISPYLFFWQAAQEVEEERTIGRATVIQRKGASQAELAKSFKDVFTGMFFSNLIAYFIILTTAATLHAHGRTHVTSAKEAAEALRPLAGEGAYLLFAIGLIGAGMLGVPVLAGSSAYALGEAAGWRNRSLDERPRAATKFYAVVGSSMLLGMAMDWLGFDAVRMLFWAAVLNGLLAPPLILTVVLLTSDKRVMGEQTSPLLMQALGWITVAVMGFCAVATIVFWATGKGG